MDLHILIMEGNAIMVDVHEKADTYQVAIAREDHYC